MGPRTRPQFAREAEQWLSRMAQTPLFQHLSDDHEPDLWRHLCLWKDQRHRALRRGHGLSQEPPQAARGMASIAPGTHEGYVDWERSEAIRRMVSNNIPNSRHHGAAKHGDALLAGLIRCHRCGRKLTLRYTGAKHDIPRYSCSRGWLDNGEPRCIAFGGLRVDDAIEAAILKVVAIHRPGLPTSCAASPIIRSPSCTSFSPGTGSCAKPEPLPPDHIAAFAGCLR